MPSTRNLANRGGSFWAVGLAFFNTRLTIDHYLTGGNKTCLLV
jgi:hypothetical protein